MYIIPFVVISTLLGIALFLWFLALIADLAHSVEKISDEMIGKK